MNTVQDYIDAISFTFEKNGRMIPPEVCMLGLEGETGELQDIIKKVLWHGLDVKDPAVRDSIKKEIGDCCWYTAVLLRAVAKKGVEFDIDIDSPDVPETDDSDANLLAACQALWRVKSGLLVGSVVSVGHMWPMLQIFAKCFVWTLTEVCEANVAKLRARYPNGFVEGGGDRTGAGK